MDDEGYASNIGVALIIHYTFYNAPFARAYIRFLFPEKSIHPFTQYAFPVDFQTV